MHYIFLVVSFLVVVYSIGFYETIFTIFAIAIIFILFEYSNKDNVNEKINYF